MSYPNVAVFPQGLVPAEHLAGTQLLCFGDDNGCALVVSKCWEEVFNMAACTGWIGAKEWIIPQTPERKR